MALTQITSNAWVIADFLTPTECLELRRLADATGFADAGVRTRSGETAMPHIRNNERVMVEDAAWVERIWSRLAPLPLPEIDARRAVALPRQLRFYKYQPCQRFKMHKDGAWQETGLRSELTLLVYLNDGFEGGATRFKDREVLPATGAALLFLHDTWHEGAMVEVGTKYVLRSDVLYSA